MGTRVKGDTHAGSDSMLFLPTLSITVWESMNRRLSTLHCTGLYSRLRHHHWHFREWRDICGWNLWRSFERTTTKLVEHKLTNNPLDEGSAHITLFIKGICHFKKRFAWIFRATRCIQSFTQTLFNRDIEIIQPPSGYLSESMSNFDTLQYTH